MSKVVVPVLVVALCLLPGGCGSETEEPDDPLAAAAFDTVAVIGSLEGEDWEVFGVITSAAISEQGSIAVLDLQARSVSVFGPTGEFVASLTARGEGPGELNQPWGLEWMGGDRLLVTDRGNARISQFSLNGSDLQHAGSMPMEFPMGDMCTIGERIFAAAYREEGTIHGFDWGGDQRDSFGAVPEIAELDGLDGIARELALRQWTVGRLLCDEADDRVLEVGTLNGRARLFAGDGTTIWQQRWEDLHMMEPVMEDGSFFGRPDEVTGAHVAQSVFLWDSERVLVQYAWQFPDDASDERRPARDSRLIHLETGTEEARSTALPRIVGRSGDRFVSLRNEPYPQLLILERVPQ